MFISLSPSTCLTWVLRLVSMLQVITTLHVCESLKLYNFASCMLCWGWLNLHTSSKLYKFTHCVALSWWTVVSNMHLYSRRCQMAQTWLFKASRSTWWRPSNAATDCQANRWCWTFIWRNSRRKNEESWCMHVGKQLIMILVADRCHYI